MCDGIRRQPAVPIWFNKKKKYSKMKTFGGGVQLNL